MLSVPFGKQFYTFDTMKYNDTYNSRVSVSNLTDDNDYYNISASTSYGKDAKNKVHLLECMIYRHAMHLSIVICLSRIKGIVV